MILGKSWLEEINPTIDWRTNTLTFTDHKNRRHVWQAIEDQTGDSDDLPLSTTQLKRLARRKDQKMWICTLKDVEDFHDALDATMTNQPAYLRDVLEEHTEVFSSVHGMPPPQPQDHQIDLVPGAKPPWQPTYHMSEKELGLLKEELTHLLSWATSTGQLLPMALS